MTPEEMVNMLLKHDGDLYRGNGKPGLTTRLFLVEETIKVIKEAFEKMAANWKAIVLMFVATLLSAAANLVLHLLGK